MSDWHKKCEGCGWSISLGYSHIYHRCMITECDVLDKEYQFKLANNKDDEFCIFARERNKNKNTQWKYIQHI